MFCPYEVNLQNEPHEESIFSDLFSAIKSLLDSEQDLVNQKRQTLMRDQKLILKLKQELKQLERLIRIFEMTYLDLKEEMQQVTRTKNLALMPKDVFQSVKINNLGQVIAGEFQMFDSEAILIDKNATIMKRVETTTLGDLSSRPGSTQS